MWSSGLKIVNFGCGPSPSPGAIHIDGSLAVLLARLPLPAAAFGSRKDFVAWIYRSAAARASISRPNDARRRRRDVRAAKSVIKNTVKVAVKATANALGFDIVPLSKVPSRNALGLRSMGIRTVIDVGANTGQFARHIRSVLPDAKVICFEPLPGPFRKLCAWADSQNGCVSAYKAALGEKEGSVQMFQHTDHSPSSSLLHSTAVSHFYYPFTKREAPLTVRMTSLDKFLDQSGSTLKPEILIKLDVQGYEDRVIDGGREAFANAKACISEVNFDSLYEGQCSFGEIWSVLDGLRYRYAGTLDQTYASDGHAVFADVLFIR